MKGPYPDWITKRVLITVKTYPSPSLSFKESVCVAGISEDGEWIRLYPIKFRDLPYEKRFKKYDVIQVNIYKDRHDIRPESHRPDPDSIHILGNISTKDGWATRKEWVLRSASPSMCGIQTMQERNEKTLGIFKPMRISDFIIEDDEIEWPVRKLRALQQLELFEKQKTVLEKVPYTFKYSYLCNDPECPGHIQSIYDWEVYALYRNLHKQYGDDFDKIKVQMRKQFLDYICGDRKDTHFFVGTMHWHPNNFIILGIFWPPKCS
jgi:hypothetical protein